MMDPALANDPMLQRHEVSAMPSSCRGHQAFLGQGAGQVP